MPETYRTILGQIAYSKSSHQDRGEFDTPPHVCELMARMTIDPSFVIAEEKPVKINAPCCGSGGMVLARAKQFTPMVPDGERSHLHLLRFTCQDINPTGVDPCFLNTSLWGIPAFMTWGDTLKMTVNKAWANVHWFRVGEDQRQGCRQLMRIFAEFPNSSDQASIEKAAANQARRTVHLRSRKMTPFFKPALPAVGTATNLKGKI